MEPEPPVCGRQALLLLPGSQTPSGVPTDGHSLPDVAASGVPPLFYGCLLCLDTTHVRDIRTSIISHFSSRVYQTIS